MKMRLSYRARQSVALLKESESRPPEAAAVLREGLRKFCNVIPFAVDNIAQYYAESEKQFHKLSDIPNWSPPFDNFFVDYNEPDYWNFGNGVVPNPFPGSQCGVAVMGLHVDKLKENAIFASRLLALMAFQSPTAWFDELMSGLELHRARWLLVCRPILSVPIGPLAGQAVWTGVTGYLSVASDGSYINYATCGECSDKAMNEFTFNIIKVLGLTTSFLHCKNVVVEESDESPGRRWHAATKVPEVKFKTLRISDVLVRRDGDSDSDSHDLRSMHICRGHFAHYSEDRPLFGKYVGTFWRPAHTRGTAARGVVVKDYETEPATA